MPAAAIVLLIALAAPTMWAGATSIAPAAGARYPSFKPGGPAGFAVAPDKPATRINVQWRPGVPKEQIAAAARRLGFRVLRTSRSGWTQLEPVGTTTPGALATSLRRAGIARQAEPARTYRTAVLTTPNDPMFSSQWSLSNTGQEGGTPGADIGVSDVWPSTTGTRDIVVAVVDEGVDYAHPDLAANMWRNSGEIPNNDVDDDANGYVDDVRGYDFYNYDSSVYDTQDGDRHGTHVAGIIGAASNNATGVAGVNWNVSIMPVKFLGPWGGDDFSAAEAIRYAVDNGAKVVNCSWGGSGTSEVLDDAIAYANKHGVLIVAAAGNAGEDTDAIPYFPAASDSPNVISVAATDRDDELAEFSNIGAETVDIAAPGVDITSTLPSEPSGLFVEAPPYKVMYLPFQAEVLEPAVQRDAIITRSVERVGGTSSTPILVVDASCPTVTKETPGERLAIYTDALVDAGYTDVGTWVTESAGTPTQSTMAGHVVVWFTGKTSWGWYDDPSVTPDQLDAIGTYLDNGGRLVMASGEMATDLQYWGLDYEWFETYFHAEQTDLLTWSSTFAGKAGARFSGVQASLPSVYKTYDEDTMLWPTGSDAVIPLDSSAKPEILCGGYGPLSGTSMAAPHVTGAAALLMARFPGVSGDEVASRLENGSHKLPALTGRTVFGGRLDVDAATRSFVGKPRVTSPLAGTNLHADTTATVKWSPAPGSASTATYEVELGTPVTSLEQGFESGTLDGFGPLTEADTFWEVSTEPTRVYAGAYASQSTTLGPSFPIGGGWYQGTVSAMQTTLTVPSGGATLTFRSKFLGTWDQMAQWWLDDGANYGFYDDPLGWIDTSVVIPEGEHVMHWAFVNFAFTPCLDAALCVDDLKMVSHSFAPLGTAPAGSSSLDFRTPASDAEDVWVRVRAVDGPNASAWTYVKGLGVTSNIEGPAKPSALTATAPGDGRVDLSWVNPADSDYDHTRVLVGEGALPSGPDDASATVAYEGTGTVATLESLQHGTEQYIAAWARDDAGNWSDPSTATVTVLDETPPEPVTFLEAALVDMLDPEMLDPGMADPEMSDPEMFDPEMTVKTPVVTWSAPSPESYDSITVLRRYDTTPTAGDPNADIIFEGRGAMVSDFAMLEAGEPEAFYTVYADDASGNRSAARSVRLTLPAPPLEGEFVLAYDERFVDTPRVAASSFVDGAEEMRFVINGDFDPTAPWVPYDEETFVRLMPIDGPQSVTAQYRDSEGGTLELTDDVYVDLKAPAALTGLKARKRSGSVQVTWDDPEDETIESYRVRRGPSETGPWTNVTPSSGVAVEDGALDLPGLDIDSPCYLAVSAIDAIGRSGPYTMTEYAPTGVVRVSGSSVCGNTAAISKAHFSRAATVVVAAAAAPADALGASALAGCAHAPVLLTARDALPSSVASEVARLGARDAIIVGGTASVSDAVVRQLESAGLNVSRIAGANRYAVAANIAARVVSLRGASWNGRVMVASGEKLADALAAGPVAYATKTPILLVTSAAVPSPTTAFVAGHGPITHALALGGTATVPTRIATRISSSVERLGGRTRYDTAVAIAQYGADHAGLSFALTGVASGLTFTDALAAGPALGEDGGVLLLTGPLSLDSSTAAALSRHKADIRSIEIYGSTASVSRAVAARIHTVTGK